MSSSNRDPTDTLNNPLQGGRLEDFAVHGTTLPHDNPTQTIAPSRRDQRAERAYNQSTGYQDLAGAADNSVAMPQSAGGEYQGMTGEVVTGTGDAMPAEMEMKNAGGGTAGGKERDYRVLRGKGEVSD